MKRAVLLRAGVVAGTILLSIVIIAMAESSQAWLWFSISYFIVMIGSWAVYSRSDLLDLFCPLLMFPLIMYLYAVSSGYYVDVNGVTYTGDPISGKTRYLFYATCLSGVISFVAGVLIADRHPVTYTPLVCRLSSVPEHIYPRVCLALGVTMALVSSSEVIANFNIFNVSGYSEWAFESRIDRQANVAAGLRDVLTFYMPVVLLLAGSIAMALTYNNPAVRVVAVAVLAAYLLTNTLAGKRGVVVEAAIPIVLFFHYKVRRVKAQEFAAVIAMGYLFVNLMAVARVSSDPLQMARLVWDAVLDGGFGLLGIAATSELWTAMNLHRLIEGIAATETGFTYGLSVLDEWSTLLPRFIYPGRPLTLSEQYANVFYPGLLEAGGGMGLFILQEGYWALGIIGVFVTMLGFGYVVQTIYSAFLFNVRSTIAVLLYGFAYAPLVMSSVRSGITGSFKSALLAVLPLVLTVVVVSLLPSSYRTEQSS